jgi:pimeloyl-ACP methyl ester carboxylesterase
MLPLSVFTPIAVNNLLSDYWRIYHSPDVLARAEQLRTDSTLFSTGVHLHLDVYAQPDQDAPILIFNHGGGGYSRLFIPLALALYDYGYTVIVPDQRGQGLSEGARDDFLMSQFVQNIVDVVHWARQHYTGKLFMAGGSLGGALTYKAAAAGAPVSAIVCHNLYDFGNPRDALAVSRFAAFAGLPIIPSLVARATHIAASLLPKLRVPYWLLGKFDKMVDERNTDFYGRYQHDPYPIKRVTLRYINSLFNTPPAIALENNPLPILVINQTRDKMVSPAVTKHNFERLGGDKAYVEIDYGHWAMGMGFEQEWSAIVDHFFKQF